MRSLLWLLVCGLPVDPWPVDYVDCMEVHTLRDDDGGRRFTQVIWVDVGGPNEIVDWRFYDQQMLPVGRTALFEDKGKPRAVRLVDPAVRHFDTRCDLEMERRKLQPLLFRRRLYGSPD